MYNIKSKNELYEHLGENKYGIDTGFKNLDKFKILDKPGGKTKLRYNSAYRRFEEV